MAKEMLDLKSSINVLSGINCSKKKKEGKLKLLQKTCRNSKDKFKKRK